MLGVSRSSRHSLARSFTSIAPCIRTPIFFGKTLDYRIDSANGDCGVLYAAPGIEGAFVETFTQELGRTSVSLKALHERPLALIHVKRPLRFVELYAKGGQMRLGLDGRILYRLLRRGVGMVERTAP